MLYLSDAFEKKQDEPALELSVIVYNINLGYNHELLDACRLLKEYAQYVAQVRAYAEKLPLPEAVEKAVDDCIKNNILAEFLAKNRAVGIKNAKKASVTPLRSTLSRVTLCHFFSK